MLYHGTSVPPTRILSEGLKPINIKQAINTVIKKFSISEDLIHIFNNKIQDYVQRKQDHLFVYLTDTIDIAIGYAKYGGNFVGLLEMEACELINITWKPNKVGYLYLIDLEGNGEIKLPYVPCKLIVDYLEISNSNINSN